MGREVQKGHTSFGNNQVEVNGLAVGMYFIMVYGDVPKVARFVVTR